MADEKIGVEKPVAPAVEAKPEKEVVASEGVKTPTVDRKVYEQVREDMKKERAERKANESKIVKLEARLAEVETRREPVDDELEEEDVETTRTKAKVDILYLIQTDSFVRDNLDLIEEKMSENPKLSAKEAIKEIKSDFFDRMQKEVSKSEPEVPPKQINPKGSNTIDREAIVKDALSGKNENADPAQLAAYNRAMERLGKK